MSEKWFRDYDCCVECGTTERKHHGHGLCINCYARWSRSQNPEKYKEYRRRYEEKPETREKRKAYHQSDKAKEAVLRSARKYRERNRELCLERTREWRDKNRDHIKAYNDAQRDVKWVKKYGKDALRKVMEEDYSCEKCGSDHRLAIHHIDWDETNNLYDNFAVLCNGCHSKLHLWLPRWLRRFVFERWMEDLMDDAASKEVKKRLEQLLASL